MTRARSVLSPALLLVVGSLLLAGCLVVAAGADTPPPPEGVATTHGMTGAPQIEAPGKPVQLLYTVSNFGYVDVCGCKHTKVRQGSVARRASLLEQLRAQGNHQLLLDGGNTVFHNENLRVKEHERKQILEKAKVVVEAMNRMGYHAMSVGHYDIVMGLDVLRDLQKRARFPMLCANFIQEETGELLFPPTAEFEVNGVKFGVLGLMLTDLQPYYYTRRAPGTRVTDALEAAQRHVPELRSRNDVVVVLSHNKVAFNRKLAAEVPGIDLIVDPYIETENHKLWLDDAELSERVGDTLIARADAQGARFGVLELRVVENGRPLVDRATAPVPEGRSSYTFGRIGIEPHFLEDPEIQQLVDAFKKGSEFVDVAALPPLPNKDRYLTADPCQACHPAQYDWWQKTTHAHAFATLEATGDQWRQDCIGCHVLGYGQTFLAPADAEPYKNVQCESCHGLNPEHPSDPVSHRWGRVQETSCLTCHNERQTRTTFQFHITRQQVACPPIKR